METNTNWFTKYMYPKKWRAHDIVALAMMVAVIEVLKRVLDFLPNVELVTLLLIVFTIFYGKKIILVAVAFTMVETFYWGVHVWVVMYLYMWPSLILIVDLTRKYASKWFYCILSAVYGLFFGFFCAVPYIFLGGIRTAFAWWIAGIPYDVVHCVSNFIVCMVLFSPLCRVMERVTQFSGRHENAESIQNSKEGSKTL